MSRPRFFADVMLGSLARWLRILGYDTAYNNRIDDEELIHACLAEDRIALTRDRRLAQRRVLKDCVLIESDSLRKQLRQVMIQYHLSVNPGLVFTRCLDCNRTLGEVSRSAVSRKVPPFVHATQKKFSSCPHCGKIFWGGTHKTRMLERLRSLL